MEKLLLTKIILSLFSLLVIFFVSIFAKSKAKQIQEKKHFAKNRYYTLQRLVNILSVIIAAGILILVWGINIKNLWISITGIIAMIAASFFATWSLISNILAGIILFFTTPFKINDRIEILPDSIKGKVLAINTFFTLLSDEEENTINIPNSMLLQKIVKNIKHKKEGGGGEEEEVRS